MRLPAVGEVFEDRYTIRAARAAGSASMVYTADDAQANLAVTLQILTPGPDGYEPATFARFAREVQIVSALTSPHTVRLLDASRSAAGLMYATFEHLDAPDLFVALQHAGRFPRQTVLQIVRQILIALREAHDAGLLHRDVTPQSVHVVEAPPGTFNVKLLDFGVARHADHSHPHATVTGEIEGALPYMSPEQLADHPLTAASDVYNVGRIMAELLVGTHALQARHPPDDIDAHGPGIAMLIRRMTAPNPQDRLSDAGAALDALDSLELPAPAPKSRRKSAVLFAGVVAGGLGAAVIGSLLLPPRQRPQAEEARTLPAALLQVRPTVEPVVSVEAADMSVDTAAPTLAPPPTGPCGRPPPFEGRGLLRDPHADTRPWVTFVPEGYDPNHAHPLLILLHQDGESPGDLLTYTGFEALAQRDGVVIIAPDGGIRPWRQDNAAHSLRRAFEETAGAVCVDPKRVWVVNQAGRGAGRILCQSWMTALVMSARKMAPCRNARPIPVLALSPKKSRHEPFEGGLSCSNNSKVSVAQMEKWWRDHNGCGDTRRRSLRHKGSECYTWTCDTPFESCHLDGGDGWPGSQPRAAWADAFGCDGTPADFPSSDTTWEFLMNAPVRE